MAGIIVIGSELDCAGFRLAGLETRSPAAAALEAAFGQALEQATLVVLTRACATALPPGLLARAQARALPLVAVVPDIAAPQADTGMARRIRAALGIGP